jgi:parvulin-like peptidyl-prolyl isomerase
MTSESFLTIDEQPISIGQVIRYLQANRKLDGFIGEIVRQFVIERELQAHNDLGVSSVLVEQAVIDFRVQQQLLDPQQFQEWLAGNGLTYEAFHAQIGMSFIDRKVFLDRVVLSRIIVAEQELAEELHSQLQEDAKFEQLAREFSLTDDRVMNGMVGPVSRGTMPDILRAAIDLAKPGDVVGPLGLEDRWGLFRVEEFIPATLDDPQLNQTLQDELFEQWLGEKIQQLPIRLQVT